MTGKEMLTGILQLDADLIEEAEFETFRKRANGVSRKKALLILLAATLVVGALTGAAVFTRWSNTMQYGTYTGVQPSEEIKKQAEKSGLSVIPTETINGGKKAVSAWDNGVTVSVAQTLLDQSGGKVVFRIEGLELEKGQAPWAWWDFLIDGKNFHELGMSCGGGFFLGFTLDDDGNPVYLKDGKPIPRVGNNQELLLDYQLSDGSIEFYIDLGTPQTGESLLGKEMVMTFTGFGIQGERFEDEDIMTVPGSWELRWTLEGSTEAPHKWMPNAKIGHWDVTLTKVEIGQFCIITAYRIDDKYQDNMDFMFKNSWNICPAGIRLKDGTDVEVFGMSGSEDWDAENHVFTHTESSLNVVLDPEQVAGMYFYSGYFINDKGFREEKPYYYIPLN